MQTYEEFMSAHETTLSQVEKDIENAINKIANEFNRRIEEMPFAKRMLPWVAIAINRAVDALENAFRNIWDEFGRVCEKLLVEAKKITGDPVQLMKLNESYNNAKTDLHNLATNYLPDVIGDVGKSWESEGAEAFADQAGLQVSAITGTISGLESAATACADAANGLLTQWNRVIQAYSDAAGEAISALEKGTDVGQILTLEVGPTIKLIGALVLTVETLVRDLAMFVGEGATVGASMWNGLFSGVPGLLTPNNSWPKIPGLDAADMKDPKQWDEGN